jgi:hypothetical protein
MRESLCARLNSKNRNFTVNLLETREFSNETFYVQGYVCNFAFFVTLWTPISLAQAYLH